MKVCAISDLHGFLPKINPCDCLFICGDITPLDVQSNYPRALNWYMYTFVDWLNSIPCQYIYIIAGNHDLILEDYGDLIMDAIYYKTNYKVVYLFEDTVELPNLMSIHGTPYCKKFNKWSFMLNDEELVREWKDIQPMDILICHDTPAIGDLDWDLDYQEHIGNKRLTELIERTKPKYVFCGHLHSCKDKHTTLGNTEIYNVSLLNNKYRPVYEPLYLEIN